MCGIAGKLWLDPARPGDATTVTAMAAALAHRGPDDHGLRTDGPVAFGHRRLTIVDLSPRGRQPMVSTDGRLMLVVNGEIYNHRALREELADEHAFVSDCDSEVVLPLYRRHWEREGPACLDRLDGMFALALWDGAERRLVLARDRVGQKPLVWARTAEAIVFASELSGLAAEPALDRTPDDAALADYLAFRCVPHPRTAWRGARKLPPASALVVEDGAETVTRYWRLAPSPDERPAPIPMEEAAEAVRHRLSVAVRRRLMSDVPVGALLSGGIDSAAVVALMAEHAGGPVRTFTIGFDDPAYDETAEARKVARLFGTEHEERCVAPDAVGMLERLLRHYGEPFADSSAIPTWLVSELAARHVKVVLTGDGGDESFAGYDRHRALVLARRLRWPPVRAALSGLAAVLPAGGHRALSTRLSRFTESVALSAREANHRWRLASPPERLAGLLTEEGRRRLGEPTPYGGGPGRGPLSLNEALVMDVEHYLPDDILVKLDIASMAHALEARSPFLDRDLMELAAALPAGLKLSGRRGKRVLRRALADVLPADVLAGRKRGFGIPLDAWFRGPLRAHAEEILLGPDARRRGLFDADAVARLLADHAERKVAAHETLFTLLVLERWFLMETHRP